MDNLRLYQYCNQIFPDINRISKFALSSENLNEIFVCHDLQISLLNNLTNEKCLICNISDLIPVSESDIIDIFLISAHNLLYVVIKTGDILQIAVDTKEVTILSKQNYFEKDIEAIGLSPDQELLVVSTIDSAFLLDSLLELINTKCLYDEKFGEHEFITVGWGKKETQFHGSEGKEAAKSKNIFISNEDMCNKNVITWKGDGTLYAVGYTFNSLVQFKVFDREGTLLYTSENQPGLQCFFSWQPTGSLIATTQVLPNKYVLTFFEKNGLKHGEFPLPFKQNEVTIKKICWSGDSELLCLWYELKESHKSCLAIYTSCNYHWYLKQKFCFNSDSEILAMLWEDNFKSVHIFCEQGLYRNFTWTRCVNQSMCRDEADDAVVGVIDGNKILLTGFRKAVIPPPMAAFVVECNDDINKIVFSPLSFHKSETYMLNSYSFCVLTYNNTFCFYSKDENNKLYLMGNCTIFDEPEKLIIFDMLWISAEYLLLTTCENLMNYIYVVQISYNPCLSLSIMKKVDLNCQIVGMKFILNVNNVYLQSTKGEIFDFTLDGKLQKLNISFPECCYQFDMLKIDGEILAFGLTQRNKFYINNVRIANNVNSYFIHSDFLMLTTLQHCLLCSILSLKNIKALQSNVEMQNANYYKVQNEAQFFVKRRIERGAKLITSVSCDVRTVMQLPRGNIEVIQPRILSLKIIGNYLDKNDYRIAFDLMRKQRINLNLLYDHNPSMFLTHLSDFVLQIDNPSWLCLFLSELDKQDVTKTIYQDPYKHIMEEMTFESCDKVEIVCEKLRECLMKYNNRNKFLLPILTTYVKNKNIKSIERALQIIKQIKDKERVNEDANIVSSNDALKYLLYMINVDELYDIALGLYDFELVMLVAEKSQKDPKEYLPYLNNLKNMDEHYRKFLIDKDLKRHPSALTHLIKCDDTRNEELISFIKNHCLYKNALMLLDVCDTKYEKIAEEYGEFLLSKKNFKEAAIMFKRSSNYEKALICFVEALEWESAVYVAQELCYSSEKINDLQSKILHKLKECGKYMEALALLESSDNVEEKILCAIEGKFYKRSLFITQKHQRKDLADEILKPAIMEQYNALMTSIDLNKKQFLSQKNRLLLIRQNKVYSNKDDEHNTLNEYDIYSDTSSIAGSTTSKTSGRSYRSSKNRRKQERKMVSLKEGSRFEDIALLRALYGLTCSTFDLRKDTSELNYVLEWFGKDIEASKLQNDLEVLLNDMSKSFDVIWPSDLMNSAPFHNYIVNVPNLAEVLEPHMRIPPVVQDYKWKLETL